MAKNFEFSIGLDITEAVRLAILEVPEDAWQIPMTQQMEDREGAGVVEITPYLDLSTWPPGTRAICRREEPHVGAQFNLFDPDGWRHQVFICNSVDDDIVYLEARHRGHARVEDHIKEAKDLGLLRLPSADFAANSAWLLVVGIAAVGPPSMGPGALPRRRARRGRAQAAPLLRLARGGAPGVKRAPAGPAPRRLLALGGRARSSLRSSPATLFSDLNLRRLGDVTTPAGPAAVRTRPRSVIDVTHRPETTACPSRRPLAQLSGASDHRRRRRCGHERPPKGARRIIEARHLTRCCSRVPWPQLLGSLLEAGVRLDTCRKATSCGDG